MGSRATRPSTGSWTRAGYAGISFGAPDQYELRRTAEEQHGILVFSAWLAGGGFALAAGLRFWKTGIIHLALVGLPLAYVAWASGR